MHNLHDATPPPSRMNNPMGYAPHPLCIAAAEEVQRHILACEDWLKDADRGKMFGVLVVEDKTGRLGFLAAYSGLLANRNDWDYFVPAVFDFQQPDGHFKRKEAEISDINRQVALLEQSPLLHEQRNLLQQAKAAMEEDLKRWKAKAATAKQRRDAMRSGAIPRTMTDEEMLRESQWMKAEAKRLRQRHEHAIAIQQDKLDALEADIGQLRMLRHQKSDTLQKWLFDHFRLLNALGEERTLTDIFKDTTAGVPPSGAGECCAPKLLQHAYKHHLRPRCIAEFWWGKPMEGEVRQHLHFYPACRGKCLPILQHMLLGLDVEEPLQPNPVEVAPGILFEDEQILVVDKPQGMLSVPGKTSTASVYDFAKHHCPQAEGPLIVHRLDMDTSGLMVVAKTKQAHQRLQAQFKNHVVEKTYVARLQSPLPEGKPHKGIINLPLRPDPTDRPRQLVDLAQGKPAVTHYEMLDETNVLLHPKTGRTHQLRVHCAHPQGLGTPIKGDPLYGTIADRLHLHAAIITFEHPTTKKRLTFESKPEWSKAPEGPPL